MPPPNLTSKQRRFLDMLFTSGASTRAVMIECGVTLEELGAWLDDPAFRRARASMQRVMQFMLECDVQRLALREVRDALDRGRNDRVLKPDLNGQRVLRAVARMTSPSRQRPRRRASTPYPRPHPDVPPAELEELFATLDRIPPDSVPALRE